MVFGVVLLAVAAIGLFLLSSGALGSAASSELAQKLFSQSLSGGVPEGAERKPAPVGVSKIAVPSKAPERVPKDEAALGAGPVEVGAAEPDIQGSAGSSHSSSRTGGEAEDNSASGKIHGGAEAEAGPEMVDIPWLQTGTAQGHVGRGAPLLHVEERSALCKNHFDFGLASEWRAASKAFCEGGTSALTCRVIVDDHMPTPTRPHTICDAEEVVMDFSHLAPADCLKHRPGYKCGGDKVFWRYPSGAFTKAACKNTAEFDVNTKWPRDHLRDLFDGWGTVDALPPTSVSAPSQVTLLVTRERGEHANLFHTMTDFLNAFIALHTTGVIDGEADGDAYDEAIDVCDTPEPIDDAAHTHGTPWWALESGPATCTPLTTHGAGLKAMRAAVAGSVGVLIMDEQAEGPFDSVWSKVYAPSHGMHRGGEYVQGRQSVKFPHVVYSPPGYTSFFFSTLTQDAHCTAATHLMRAFRRFLLSGMGVRHMLPRSALAVPANQRGAPVGDVITVTFISRRPYNKHVSHAFVGRQVDNEAELVGAMLETGRFRKATLHVQLVDMVHLSLEEQVRLIARSDVLVGMHGAALSHMLAMPPWGGVFELWPKPTDMWRCFEHMARWAGLAYGRLAASGTAPQFRTDKNGDYTTVPLGEFRGGFGDMLQSVQHRRMDYVKAMKEHAQSYHAGQS